MFFTQKLSLPMPARPQLTARQQGLAPQPHLSRHWQMQTQLWSLLPVMQPHLASASCTGSRPSVPAGKGESAVLELRTTSGETACDPDDHNGCPRASRSSFVARNMVCKSAKVGCRVTLGPRIKRRKLT